MTNEPPASPRSSSSATDESIAEPTQRRPFYRSPYFWGFIVGVVVITALRPFMRHIPDPPPVGEELPALAWTEIDRSTGTVHGGATIHHGAPDERVLLLTTVAGTCGPECEHAIEVASNVEQRMRRADVPASFVTIAAHTTPTQRLLDLAKKRFPYADDWRILTVDEPQRLAAVLDGRGEHRSERSLETISQAGYVWLVDGAGRLRGRYEAGGADIESELYHRSLRIIGRY